MKKAGALYRARTAHLWTTLRPPGLALNEKQIPRFVGNNGNASRKWNDWNELSCAQGRRATRLRYAPTDSMIIRQVYSERRGVAWGSKIWEGTEERDHLVTLPYSNCCIWTPGGVRHSCAGESDGAHHIPAVEYAPRKH